MNEYIDEILTLFNLKIQISGLNFPFNEILRKAVKKQGNISEYKQIFLSEINRKIQKILESNKKGITDIFELKKMKNTPFQKFIPEIIKIRKEEFEGSPIYKKDKNYNISEIADTYYGKEIIRILEINDNEKISQIKLKKIKNIAKKLDLDLKIVK
jgi:hypothetical protein